MRPFSNGSEWLDWQDRNCDRCKSARHDCDFDDVTCPAQRALVMAAGLDGEIPDEIASTVGDWKGELFFPNCAMRLLDFDAMHQEINGLRKRVRYLQGRVNELENRGE